MNNIITYEEFSKLVPKRTKKFIDDFLTKLVIKCNYSGKSLDVLFTYMLILYIEKTKIISIPETKGFISQAEKNKYMSHEGFSDLEFDRYRSEEEIASMFEEYSNYFCILDEPYEYLTLTPEKILYNLLNLVSKIELVSPSSLERDIQSYLTHDLLGGNPRVYNNIVVNSIKREMEDILSYFNKLPIETIKYFETVSKIFQAYNADSYYDQDDKVKILFLALFFSDFETNNVQIYDYLSNFVGLSGNKIESVLNIIKIKRNGNGSNTFGNVQYEIDKKFTDLSIILYYYSNFLTMKCENNQIICSDLEFDRSKFSITNSSISIEDIISALGDKAFLKSFEIERIFLDLGLDYDKFKNIKEEINTYSKGAGDIKKNEALNEIYRDNPKKVGKYIEYLSRVYKVFDIYNKEGHFTTKYTDPGLFSLAVFYTVLKRGNYYNEYFISKGINLEKYLAYLNLKESDIILDEDLDVNYLKEASNKIKKCNFNPISIEKIMGYYIDREVMYLIYKDLDQEFEIENLLKKIELFNEKKKEQAKIKVLQKVYEGLDVNVIKFIEASTEAYSKLDKKNTKYNINEKIELSLLMTFLSSKYTKKDNIYKYLEAIIGCNDIYGYFALKYTNNVNPIYTIQIDEKIIAKYYGKYIFGGENKNKNKKDITISDIMKNIFNKNINCSPLLEAFLYEFSEKYSPSRIITYDYFESLEENAKKYLEEQERKEFDKTKNKVLARFNTEEAFQMVDNIDKICRTFEKYKNLNNNGFYKNVDSAYLMSIIIYLYYFENSMREIFLARDITLNKVLDYMGIEKEKMDTFKQLETNYEHILTLLETFEINYNQGINNVVKQAFDKSIYYGFNNHDRPIRKFISRTLNSSSICDEFYKEIEEERKYISKEEKLEHYKNLEVPAIEVDSIEAISDFGSSLALQSNEIIKEFSSFVDSKDSTSDNSLELQKAIKSISNPRKPVRKFSWFNKDDEEEKEVTYTKKDVLERLSKYLNKKSVDLRQGLKELQFIRVSIGEYLLKANEYLENLKQAKTIIDEEISSRIYAENDFRVYDDQLKIQIVTDKISSINLSILQMLQQYQKVVMLMSTHASLINQIEISKNTTLQNLYIELSLNEEIAKEKNTIDSLTGLMSLLDNLSLLNSQEIVNNIEKINSINKRGKTSEITESDRMLINQILEEQNLLVDSTATQKTSENSEGEEEKIKIKRP